MTDGPGSQSPIGSFHYGSCQNSLERLTPQAEDKPPISPCSAYVAIVVLCYVNLVNYVERYTIAGIWCLFCLWAFFWEGGGGVRVT